MEIENRHIEISKYDREWIAERGNTAPSGSISFTRSAIKRYRRLTNQEYEAAWKIRHQMIDEFGKDL